MSEESKALIRRMNADVWNKGKLDLIDELCAPDLFMNNAPPEVPPGSEGMKAFIGMYRSAFPDLEVTSHFLVAEGDKVVDVWTSRATHTGELMGIPATGKQIEMHGISVVRIADGKIVELWNGADQLPMMQQLGVIPS